MTPRTPSLVPFLVFFGLAMLLASILPSLALLQNPLLGAAASLLSVLGALCALSLYNLLPGRQAQPLPPQDLIVPALWLPPVLLLMLQSNPMALLCAVPLLLPLRGYLPNRPVLAANAYYCAILLHATVLLQSLGRPSLALLLAIVTLCLLLWQAEMAPGLFRFRFISGTLAACLVLFLMNPPPMLEPGSGVLQATPIAPTGYPDAKGKSDRAQRGIILIPEVEERAHLLPPPPLLKEAHSSSTPAIPLDIPFSGVYWLFQPPLAGPPEGSLTQRGTPASFRFRSDDTTPVRLEARQTFNKPLPAARLASITVTLSSQDIYPNTLHLQLIATHSAEGNYRMNLGTVPVAFLPDAQTLTYTVPPSGLLSQFDGLILRFMLTPPRMHVAPRISVEKFRLTPR